jgi:hypothetical protein
MSTTTVILLLLIVWLIVRDFRCEQRRSRLVAFIFEMVVMPRYYEKARRDFFSWIESTPPELSDGQLWIAAFQATEEGVKRWDTRMPMRTKFLFQLLSQARDEAKTKGWEAAVRDNP